MDDIIKLAEYSKMAKTFGNNYEIVDINDYHMKKSDDLTFHPNGNCGCVNLNDEVMFGIRCDHLMWAEGHCEGMEYFWNENDHNNGEPTDKYNMIIVYGNHKGLLSTKLIVFHK